jgi:hypothetical protein
LSRIDNTTLLLTVSNNAVGTATCSTVYVWCDELQRSSRDVWHGRPCLQQLSTRIWPGPQFLHCIFVYIRISK